MLDKFIYEDHRGTRFVGLENGVYLNYSDLRDYSWSFDTINSRISRFYRPTTTRKIPLVVYCANIEDALDVRNRLFELTEGDIEARRPGKIYIGDYYTVGYVTASKKSNYLVNKRYCHLELTLVSDDPVWHREQTFVFLPGSEGEIGTGGGVDFPYEYKYDYGLSLRGQTIVCSSVGGNDFRLLVYGEAGNPSVIIGGHSYAINGNIGVGETLLIDSLAKTITLTTAAGNQINWFDKRGRVDYIFEKIPSGQNTVSWVGTFGFDLTIIEKRSEPKWT